MKLNVGVVQKALHATIESASLKASGRAKRTVYFGILKLKNSFSNIRMMQSFFVQQQKEREKVYTKFNHVCFASQGLWQILVF